MNHYLSDHEYVKQEYFDTVQYKVNPQHMEKLQQAGLDQRLAFHVASLFARDPIPMYSNELDETMFTDCENTSHFENL